ncbi:hypothetical protein AKJ16_DCAP11444 [Drosera capensis]
MMMKKKSSVAKSAGPTLPLHALSSFSSKMVLVGAPNAITGYKKEIVLEKHLVERESVFWRTGARSTSTRNIKNQGSTHFPGDLERLKKIITPKWVKEALSSVLSPSSFPSTEAINDRDKWIEENIKVEIYEVKGIHSLNVVVRNILDGGVNCSRRID